MDILRLHDVFLIPIAYVVGGFTTGYYLVKAKERIDLREKGDGSLGARNVYKLLGPVGFLTTALLDTLKGAATVLYASTFAAIEWVPFAVAAAVVTGHVFPAHLGFRGGKGVMTSVGTMLVLDPLLLAAFIGLMTIVLIILRKLDLSGLIVVAFSPAIAYGVGREGLILIVLLYFALVILWTHRAVVREELFHPSAL